MPIDIVPLKSDLFAIRFHRKRWLKLAKSSETALRERGWRPIVWVEDFAEAEKFATHRAAETFARANVTGSVKTRS